MQAFGDESPDITLEGSMEKSTNEKPWFLISNPKLSRKRKAKEDRSRKFWREKLQELRLQVSK